MITQFGALWGGEVAAAKLTQYLRPEVKTIYAATAIPEVQARLPVDGDSRHELQEIEVVTTIHGHLANLSRRDRRSSRGSRRIDQQLSLRADIDLAALDRTYFESNV